MRALILLLVCPMYVEGHVVHGISYTPWFSNAILSLGFLRMVNIFWFVQNAVLMLCLRRILLILSVVPFMYGRRALPFSCSVFWVLAGVSFWIRLIILFFWNPLDVSTLVRVCNSVFWCCSSVKRLVLEMRVLATELICAGWWCESACR